ncbi:MAG: hypothetical protein H0V92_00495 [Pseudonocardiales bacterium]|nr:hypothetical protein [Pseudonocardiales bacterium]
MIGRLVYFAGWVEHTLGELTVLHHPEREMATDTGWGLSGARLVSALRRIDDPNGALAEAINEYEELLKWRNKIIHTGWVVRDPHSVMGFHAPMDRGVPTMTSYALSYGVLESMITRWRHLERVVDELVSAVMGLNSK